ncbi:multiple PDZ domain protein, partial [Aplysia californica]|uniref:Multiple PDZ domain protein n=1 Tax=Aplysia californica TaxID=6500 RepID=A0ABM0JZR0_APLCA
MSGKMSLVNDSETAAEYVEVLQRKLWTRGDHSQDDELSSIIYMLDSPLFKQLLTLQESLQELKHVSQTQPLSEESFDITASGELILNDEAANGFTPEHVADSSTLKLRGEPFDPAVTDTLDYGQQSELDVAVEKVASGRPVHEVQLFKPESQSLGFSVVGVTKPDNEGQLGIYVQDIQPGGIAAQDGQLREGDQLVAINGQPLDISHHEAIRLLQGARGTVHLLVARPLPASDTIQAEEAVSTAATPRTTEE